VNPFLAKNDRHVVKLCAGTFRDVAVYTTRLIAVNMGTIGLPHVISLYKFLCVPTLTDRCTPSSPQTFSSAYARRLWRFLRNYSIGYGCLVPKTLIFPPISHFCPLWSI